MLKKLLTSSTLYNSQITATATLINGLLGAFFYILLARFLGPIEYGVITISIAVLTLVADIADLGTNTGIVRFLPGVINTDKAVRILKMSLELKFCVWIFVLLGGFFASPLIANEIFHKSDLLVPLRLSLVGVGGALFLSYVTSSLQAMQKFFTWSIINIATNFLRLVIILLLILAGQLSIYTGLITYIALPFLGFSLGLFFLPLGGFLRVKDEFKSVKNILQYNLSVAVFSAIAAVSSRLDTFLNAAFLTSRDVGIYGAANQLVSVMPQIISALGVVLAPKFANFKNSKDMIGYFFKTQIMVTILAFVGLIIVVPFAAFLIPLLLGVSYNLSVFPFIILFCAMLIFMISLPLHTSIIYYFSRPDIFIWVSIGHLFLIASFGYFLIPRIGVSGSALAVLAGTTFNFLIPLVWFAIRINKEHK